MAINFGELDRYGKVPANELKEKIRGIAYDAIREAFTNWSADEARGFLDEVGGIFNMTEMLCDQIDEEVVHTNAEMQLMLKEYAEGQKNEED